MPHSRRPCPLLACPRPRSAASVAATSVMDTPRVVNNRPYRMQSLAHRGVHAAQRAQQRARPADQWCNVTAPRPQEKFFNHSYISSALNISPLKRPRVCESYPVPVVLAEAPLPTSRVPDWFERTLLDVVYAFTRLRAPPRTNERHLAANRAGRRCPLSIINRLSPIQPRGKAGFPVIFVIAAPRRGVWWKKVRPTLSLKSRR